MTAKISKLHSRILEVLRETPATPEAVRELVLKSDGEKYPINTIRARFSDLANPRDEMGRRLPPFIVSTGKTGRADGGRQCNIMRVLSDGERMAWVWEDAA